MVEAQSYPKDFNGIVAGATLLTGWLAVLRLFKTA